LLRPLAIAFWIAHLVRDVNERFDQIEHKLDVIMFQLESNDSQVSNPRVKKTT